MKIVKQKTNLSIDKIDSVYKFIQIKFIYAVRCNKIGGNICRSNVL